MPEIMKICGKCKVEQPRAGFRKNTMGKDGYRSVCKKCDKEYRREYIELNKDKIAIYRKSYSDINKEAISCRTKQWYIDNKERLNTQSSQWHKNKGLLNKWLIYPFRPSET